ncbi:hypothetical protein HYR99_39085 [Candidatus Poribacteria bacterium]|nr:hypothetical protein [Candidatus Poribacteria bacterium]
MIRYRLLQRKEKDTTTRCEYWFSIAIAVQCESGIAVRQWGRIPFLTKKRRLEALNLLDVPKSQRQYPVRWTEIRTLNEERPLWMVETLKQTEPVEREVVEKLLHIERSEIPCSSDPIGQSGEIKVTSYTNLHSRK